MTGLREALEKLADERDSVSGHVANDYHIRPYELRDLLAAHPAEPAPVANRERVAEVLNDHYYDVGWSKERQGFRCVCGWLGEDHVQHVTDALAAGVFRDEAKVKAEAVAAVMETVESLCRRGYMNADALASIQRTADRVAS